MRAFWAELWQGAKYWSIDDLDGLPPLGRISVSAYCAHCPRCFQEKEHLTAKLWLCDGCGLTVEGTYRQVVITIPTDKLPDGFIRKAGLVAGNLLGVHPAMLQHEQTIVDVTRWSEFIDQRKAWSE